MPTEYFRGIFEKSQNHHFWKLIDFLKKLFSLAIFEFFGRWNFTIFFKNPGNSNYGKYELLHVDLTILGRHIRETLD